MWNYNKNDGFWLFTYVHDEAMTSWIDAGLPVPSLLIHGRFGYFAGWIIEGYFGTKKNRKFLADIYSRLAKTLLKEGAKSVERLPWRPKLENLPDYAHYYPDLVYNLRDDFSPVLESITEPRQTMRDEALATLAYYDRKTEDELFDSIRFTIYDFVRANGKSALSYEYVETIALTKYEIIGGKGESTARSKAKAIYEWVMEFYEPGSGVNNWNYERKTKDEEELRMTRTERAKLNAKMKYERAQAAVLGLVKGLIADEFRKKDGSWNVTRIAKHLGMDPKTIRKHLRELTEKGLL